MPLQAQEVFVSVDQGKLFCRTFGEKTDSPAIVVHGGPGLGHDHLLPQLSAIGEFSFAIFYDQRGTGQSTTTRDDWQADPFGAYVKDIEQIRKAFGLDTITLLCHSWGGLLASQYVLAYPDRVRKIIYLNSVPVSSEDYLAFVKHRTELVDLNKSALDEIRASSDFIKGNPEAVEKFYRIYFKKYFAKPEQVQQLTLTMTPKAAINNFKIYNLFYQYISKHAFNPYPGLKQLNKPTTIITADQDMIPLHYAEKLNQAIPSSKLIVMENCGHFPYIEQPDMLFKILRDALQSMPN